MQHADVAQLVEHNLAKVGVASSNLVIRSQQVLWHGGVAERPKAAACKAVKPRVQIPSPPQSYKDPVVWRSGSALP